MASSVVSGQTAQQYLSRFWLLNASWYLWRARRWLNWFVAVRRSELVWTNHQRSRSAACGQSSNWIWVFTRYHLLVSMQTNEVALIIMGDDITSRRYRGSLFCQQGIKGLTQSNLHCLPLWTLSVIFMPRTDVVQAGSFVLFFSLPLSPAASSQDTF